ncbi:hypothetical protein [Variovorax boronicumulans]|uniref:hypothetical protein n=1 Tax=Variovorax boronicumulans TaxID=436515 RepID=UPI002780EEA2|nr:hypothetical protein [Variovorax boronicumulans]MDQ0042819.1 putative amidohydrolase [Variovorax boronicumulans]
MKLIKIQLREHISALLPDETGLLPLRLVQTASGLDVQNQIALPDTPLCGPSGKSLPLPVPSNHGLTVMSYCEGIDENSFRLTHEAPNSAAVMLAGTSASEKKNITYVSMGRDFIRQEKFSLSSEDEKAQLTSGDSLHLYTLASPSQALGTPDPVRCAVLNCHEYTHVGLMTALMVERIEVLVVVAHNAAARLYWEYARSDVHRLSCYVIIVNSAELGGSAVFAPYRRLGTQRNAQFSASGQLFGTRGPGAFTMDMKLNIGLLRRLRRDFENNGFDGIKSKEPKYELDAMVPSQHYLKTFDAAAGPPVVKPCCDVPTDQLPDSMRVAVAQLESMSMDVYKTSRYRLAGAKGFGTFMQKLSGWLQHVEFQCGLKSERPGKLDLLALPEVFVPRAFLPQLQAFSDRTGAMVVAGVDYPDDEDANECAILRPGRERLFYRKVTRSQYDGQLPGKDGGRMKMKRGDQLLRFVDLQKRAIGVLICYDYSHLDLLARLNLEMRDKPLDMVVVVAHNPFGDLYRSSCIADANRFYQYIVMSNVATYGGSGVFGPIRSAGARQVLAETGKNSETVLIVDVDLKALEQARARGHEQELGESGFQRRPGILKQLTALKGER